MSKLSNPEFCKKVKAEIYKQHSKHCAYRSGLLAQEYKRRGGTYTGTKTQKGLTRWFSDDWRNQRGKIGYMKTGDIYRPTKRITFQTPTTHGELSAAAVRKAMEEKPRAGRVRKY